MKKLIVIIALFFGAIAHAQTEADIRNDEAFQQILEKQIAFTLTENRESLQAVSEFQQLVPEGFDSFAFSRDALGFKEWISSRIDDSGFESVEDAVAQFKTFLDVTNRTFTKSLELGEEKKKVKENFENKELFDKVYREEWEKEMSKFSAKPLE